MSALVAPLIRLLAARKGQTKVMHKNPRTGKFNRGQPAKVSRSGKSFIFSPSVLRSKKHVVRTRNDGQGNQIQTHKHGNKLGKLPLIQEYKVRNALQPLDTYVKQQGFIVEPETGGSLANQWAQCAYKVFEAGSVQDVDAIITYAGRDSANQAQVGFNGKLFIKDYSMQLKIINQHNGLANLKVYEYICRRGVNAHYQQSTQNIVNEGWSTNYQPTGLSFQQPINRKTLSATLFSNPLFCSHFKVIKVTNYQLGAGKELMLAMSHLKPKVVNPAVWNSNDDTTEPSYTRGYVIQVMGQPANGSTADDQFTTFNMTSFKINVLQINRYHFQTGYDVSGNEYCDDLVNTYSDVPNSAPQPTTTHVQFMSPITDVPVIQGTA